MLFLNPSHTDTHTLSHIHMHRRTIEEKVDIIYARARPFVYLCMAAGESRDHFNHKGKSVLISSLRRCQDEWMMQHRRFDISVVDGAIKKTPHFNSPTQWSQNILWLQNFTHSLRTLCGTVAVTHSGTGD